MATTISGIEELKARVGDHLGYSDWLVVTQERINTVADLTPSPPADMNPT